MIYIITHKIFDDEKLEKNIYKVLHVGTNDDCKSSYLRDDTGDNISKLNSMYCELTGQYWIWKNVKDKSICGLVHYRRYFTTRIEDLIYTYFNKMPNVLDYTRIEKELIGKNEIILPRPTHIFRTVREYYAELHCIEDLDITRDVVKEKYPEYLGAFDNTMNSHKFYYGNMLITSKELFDAYSEWLFDILFEVEKRIDVTKNGDKYQARVMGFLSERLIQVWVMKNRLKIKEFPVFNIEERRWNIFKVNYSRVRRVLKRGK